MWYLKEQEKSHTFLDREDRSRGKKHREKSKNRTKLLLLPHVCHQEKEVDRHDEGCGWLELDLEKRERGGKQIKNNEKTAAIFFAEKEGFLE